MIPVLMSVFALGGTTFGMAEESLAFYALVITVMIAAGYDALTGAAIVSCSAAASVCSDRRSTRSRPGSRRVRRHLDQRRAGRPARHPHRRPRDRHLLRAALRRPGEGTRPKSLVYDMKADNEAHFRAEERGRRDPELTGRHKLILTVFGLAFLVMMYGVIPWEDLGIPSRRCGGGSRR